MLNLLLQAGNGSGLQIAQTLLVVVSLLIPAIVFLVSMFRDEEEIEGPLQDMVDYSPASLGKTLGLQSLSIAILVIAINIFYILFTRLFSGLLSISIESVGLLSGLGILFILMILFLMVWSLSSNSRNSDSEVDRAIEEVDSTILHERNKELEDKLIDKKEEIAALVNNFKRLQIQLNRRDDIPDSTQELVDQLTDPSSVSDEEEREKEAER